MKIKVMFQDDNTFLPSTAKLPNESGYHKPVSVPKEVFDGLVRTWGSTDCNPADIHGTMILSSRLGNKESAEWVYAHEEAYGFAFWHGLVVKPALVPNQPTCP